MPTVGTALPAQTDYPVLIIADVRFKTLISLKAQEKELLNTGGLKRKPWISQDLEQLCKRSKLLTARAFKYQGINVTQVRLI